MVDMIPGAPRHSTPAKVSRTSRHSGIARASRRVRYDRGMEYEHQIALRSHRLCFLAVPCQMSEEDVERKVETVVSNVSRVGPCVSTHHFDLTCAKRNIVRLLGDSVGSSKLWLYKPDLHLAQIPREHAEHCLLVRVSVPSFFLKSLGLPAIHFPDRSTSGQLLAGEKLSFWGG